MTQSQTASVLENDVIEGRRHFNVQLPQHRFHGCNALLIRFPIDIFIFPERNVDKVEFAVGLDTFVKLAADIARLLGDIDLYVLPSLHELCFLLPWHSKDVDQCDWHGAPPIVRFKLT
ncbi:MAG: hypothetical protein P0121_10765 [Nitrospira sp.]|nr:hypothetical protein [Nitrospira sp.]